MTQVNIYKRSKSSQKGFGDNMAIIYIFGICCAASIVLGILSWCKGIKDARDKAAWEHSIQKNPSHRGPSGYTIVQ